LFSFLLKLITWPVRALIRSAAQQRKAVLERQQLDAAIAHRETERAAEEAREREYEEHRSAGEYVPYLDYYGILSVCHGVAEVHGYAYEAYRSGIPAEPLAVAFGEIEARFGTLTSAIFGVDPRSVIRPDNDDYYNCLAASAFLFISSGSDLRLVTVDGGSPEISGTVGCQRLGIFARATGAEPTLRFAKRHNFYDLYYVAKNFTPDQTSAEAHYRQWVERANGSSLLDSLQTGAGFHMERAGISGTFGPQLTWLTKRLFRQRQGM